MQSIFSEVKEYLTPRSVVEFFLGQPVKSTYNANWYVSPFRNEKTASFCVNDDKGIHDFGDASHYDIISFTAKYNNCSQKEACNLLISTFNLPIKEKKIMTKELAKQINERKKEKEEKKIAEQWFKIHYPKLCDKYITELKSLELANWNDLVAESYIKKDKLEFLVDQMRKRQPIDIYKSNLKEVIEEYVNA